MAETHKKASHPPFARMVCDAMHAMDANLPEGERHGHSLQALKKQIGETHQLSNGWETRLSHAVNMMVKKRQLAHVPHHMGTFKLSKSMQAKEEKRLKRKPRAPKFETGKSGQAEKAEEEAKPETKQAPKRKGKAAKVDGPAKRAKKVAPKKAPMKRKAAPKKKAAVKKA